MNQAANQTVNPTGMSAISQKRLALNTNQQAFLLFLLILGSILLIWEVGARMGWFSQLMPSASATLKDFWWWVSNPFFDYGPNDRGVG